MWKLLLRVKKVSASSYIDLVELGPSELDEKIRNDTFRTMTTDASFLENVTEDSLIRLLNAFVWTCEGKLPSNSVANTGNKFYMNDKDVRANTIRKIMGQESYVQGMNILAAPFLMTMPEMEAFFSFSKFIWKWCPLYVQPTMKGVHCGLKLLDLCLHNLDPTLYGYLRGKNISANTYAFASVMTFSACTPPLKELLYLWDYLFAYGFHLNILFIIAQLALIRKEILQSPSPGNLLRVLPPLNAKEIINLTISLCKNLSLELYDKLVRHAYDASVADSLGIKTTTRFYSEQHDDTLDLPPFMLDAMSRKKAT
ncbi:rab-GTPase-TBC domain-containing protein [Blakeslea trispora]|nr:rab-GTPase-TBC domain-containing protein [Blakeslea trispora]